MRWYSVRSAAAVTRELDLIEDHLVQVYQSFGDDLESATERAAARINEALACMRTFESRPHRGTEHSDIQSGIRTVTSNKFILYFERLIFRNDKRP